MGTIAAKTRAEFGDFQTPLLLADRVCELLARRGCAPVAVVEPTCGSGSFLLAALRRFPSMVQGLGVDINSAYVEAAEAATKRVPGGGKIQFLVRSFFDLDWPSVFKTLPEPLLVLGNPPWVTNAQLGALGSENVPVKTNFQNHSGLDALTGKSNFDISEWMLIRLLDWLQARSATIAVLCKTAVARKVLNHAWTKGVGFSAASMWGIDAGLHFDAAVDACLLLINLAPDGKCDRAEIHANLIAEQASSSIGFRDGLLISNVEAYERWKHLAGTEPMTWRSGVKHDCSSVMELRRIGNRFKNGLEETVEFESDLLFPLLKSSDIAADITRASSRFMLIPQRSVGEETDTLRERAPLTWAYLQSHSARLAKRGSSIYRGKPAFSVFGVGPYTFAPWKVAISGLYKKLKFSVVGPQENKPVVLDDTCYSLACGTEAQAVFVAGLLNSDIAKEFLGASIFWDAKRPITVDVLRRLNLRKLAQELGLGGSADQYLEVSATVAKPHRFHRSNELTLFG